MAWIYFGFSILISFLKIALVVTLIVAMIAVVDHFVNVLPRVNAAKTVPQEPLDGRGFSTKKLPANIDAIVIGSGIGGLTTASLLARRGL